MNRRDVSVLCAGVAVVGWTAFATLALLVAAGTRFRVDETLLAWWAGHRPGPVLAVARGVTATGTSVVPYALAVSAGLTAGRNVPGRLRATALCVGCLGSAQALRYGVMELVRRPRPPHAFWATHATGWSFPSGHATTAAVTAGLLVLAVTARGPRRATALRLVIGCWGLLVGLSRVYLGVHWLSDVVGGWLFATGWLATCLWAAARWLPGPLRTGAGPEPDGPDGGPGR